MLRPATGTVEVQNRKISNYSQRPNSLWQFLQPVTSVNETLNGALPRKGLFVSHGRNELVEAVWMLKTNSYHYSNDTLDGRISEIVGHWTLGQTFNTLSPYFWGILLPANEELS